MWICQRCQPETKCSSYTAIFKMKSWWEVGEQASMNYPWPTSWLAYRLPAAWLSFLLSLRWIRSPQTLLRESSPLPLLSLLELRPASPGPLYILPWNTHALLTFLPSTQVGWEAGWEEVCLSTWLEIEAQSGGPFVQGSWLLSAAWQSYWFSDFSAPFLPLSQAPFLSSLTCTCSPTFAITGPFLPWSYKL